MVATLPKTYKVRCNGAEAFDPSQPRDEIGRWTDEGGNAPSPEQARAMRDNSHIPEGWYVHGRSGGSDLNTGFVTQVTRDWSIADQYAGAKGSKWMLSPSEGMRTMDFSSVSSPDVQKVLDKLKTDLEDGTLSPELESIVKGAIENDLDALEWLVPKDLVDSAGMFDVPEFNSWLWEAFETGFVKTADDTGVFLDAASARKTMLSEGEDKLNSIQDFRTRTRFTNAERINVIASGKRYRCDFIEPGLVDYSDSGGGIEYLPKETIDDALNTALGNPLTMGHISTRLNDFTELAHGKNDSVGYDEKTGWYYSEGSVDTDEGREGLKNKRPSCGYRVLEFGPAGTYHNIRYTARINKIRFHHLAIVDRPRYEGGSFRLNSKNATTATMFKWIKNITRPKKDGAGEETVTEEGQLPADSTIEIDGKPVRLNALTELHKKSEAEKAERENAVSGADEVEIDGKRVKINALVESYQKHNEADESEEGKKKKSDEEKAKADRENAVKAESEKKAKEEAERKNEGTKHFKILANASSKPVEDTSYRANSVGGIEEGLARGKAYFKNAKTTAGKN